MELSNVADEDDEIVIGDDTPDVNFHQIPTDESLSNGPPTPVAINHELSLPLSSLPANRANSSSSSSDSPAAEPGVVKKKKKKILWRLKEMKNPSWWPRMLWSEKGSLIYFCFIFTFCVCMGTLVRGWHSFLWQAWYAIGVTIMAFFLLVRCSWIDPSLTMMWSLTMLLSGKIVTVRDACAGFGSNSVIAIGILFATSASISATGSLTYFTKYVLGKTSSVLLAQIKVCIPVAMVSGFVANTPVVAMMIPVVENFARDMKIPASKLMIPLSYSAIIGGTLTIIGTSTNLIVVALVQKRYPDFEMGFFEVAKVGGPICVIGLIYIFTVGRWLLPVRESPLAEIDRNPRRYMISMRVDEEKKNPISPRLNVSVAGKTIEEAGLRHLQGVFLIEVEREAGVFPAPAPDFVLQTGDLLLFAGDVFNVSDLLRIKGISPSTDDGDLLVGYNRVLIEAVVSAHSSLVGYSVSQCNFRNKFDAAIISIFRSGTPVTGKLGTVELEVGDTLLMIAKSGVTKFGHSDFAYVTQVTDTNIKFHPVRIVLAPLCSLAMIAVTSAELTDLLTAVLICLFAVYVTGCISFDQICDSINMPVLVVIAASFPMATALETWGVARELASNLLSITEFAGDYGIIFGVYLSTCLLTALLSNASSAAIMVPISLNLVDSTSIPLMAYVVTVMVAASADFSTPIGYQTNLMVWGPGGYKFLDYPRVGVPLQLILAFSCSGIILMVYAS